MPLNPVICNSSPLIGLQQIRHLSVLEGLFETIVVPLAVVAEVEESVVLPAWIEPIPLGERIGPLILRASLGAGESEAISLALETNARLIILDDRPARRLAQSLNLTVVGTLGLLLLAKKKELISSVKPLIDELMAFDFRVAPALYKQLLEDAGEGI